MLIQISRYKQVMVTVDDCLESKYPLGSKTFLSDKIRWWPYGSAPTTLRTPVGDQRVILNVFLSSSK